MTFDPSIPIRSHARVLVIGCGNLLRGDDATGPVLVRRLWQRGLPEGMHCADGGTGGMDVAFQMRGVEHVILVDACTTGDPASPPGTLYEIPGSELEQLPPLTGINLHSFRWDHALAFARWLLKEDYPKQITVYLIEAQSVDHGADITPRVSQAIDRLADILIQPIPAQKPACEITADGYLRLDRQQAEQFFPEDSLVALHREGQLWLLPTRGPAAGGYMLKQRNAQGDRTVLLAEVFQFQSIPAGHWPATWDEAAGALRIEFCQVESREGAGVS